MKRTASILVGLLIALLAVLNFYRVWQEDHWLKHLQACVFSFGAVILWLFPDIASEYSAHQGWTRNQIRYDPEWALRLTACLMSAGAFYSIWLA